MVIVSDLRSTGAVPLTTGAGPSTCGAQAARPQPSNKAQDAKPRLRRAPIRILIVPARPPTRKNASYLVRDHRFMSSSGPTDFAADRRRVARTEPDLSSQSKTRRLGGVCA